MTSPDFRTFVDTLIGDHQSWVSSHASPSGTDFFDHYVGDEVHPAGLLRRYEAWRFEHGYTRVRPWNGTEALERPATSDIPSEGERAGVRVRVLLDRIRVLDPYGPLVHGSGRLSLIARVSSEEAGGIGATTTLPPTGAYPIPGPHGDTVRAGWELFRGPS